MQASAEAAPVPGRRLLNPHTHAAMCNVPVTVAGRSRNYQPPGAGLRRAWQCAAEPPRSPGTKTLHPAQ